MTVTVFVAEQPLGAVIVTVYVWLLASVATGEGQLVQLNPVEGVHEYVVDGLAFPQGLRVTGELHPVGL